MWTNHYCPNCCEWNYDIIIRNDNVDFISCPTRIKIPVKFDDPNRTTLIIKCHSCNWEGDHKELLTKEEIINKNRTKLIERMLNV